MKSKAMIDQIRTLHQAGNPIRKISTILCVSRNTVRRYLRSEEQKTCEVSQKNCPNEPFWESSVDWEKVLTERRKGATSKVLFEELEPRVSYSQFCRVLRERLKTAGKSALRLHHRPGERVHIDFCDGIPVTNLKTGKASKTHLFVGVLPFSSYTFATFVENQKLSNFIACHQKMWQWMGGVTPYVVVDNLRAGVKKAHRYDPETNPTYCDYGNEAGFAVLPARPYTPRDKASVESNIGAIQREFFQRHRNRDFYSLAELNQLMHVYIQEFNYKKMKDYGVSRAERFSKEKSLLLPTAGGDYELELWKQAKVHPDCCVQVDHSYYSAPYRFIGQNVKVKLGKHTLEIFDNDIHSIASHARSQSKHKHIINESHLPEARLQSSSFEVQKSLAKAKSVGPKLLSLVEHLLSGSRPLKFLRRVQGILRLLDLGINSASLEFAATQAMTFGKTNLSFIKNCAEQHQFTGGRIRISAPLRDPSTIYLHGESNV